MQKTKTKNKVNGSTIAIIALSILLIVAIGIGVVLAYFTANQTVTGTITLGNPVTISITQGGAAVSSLTFSGDALPGTVYDQPIGITAPAEMTTALMRAKLTISNTDGATINVQATPTTDWQTGTDEYYYYKGTVGANASIDFVTDITIPTSLTNADAKKTYTIDVVVETIQQANNAANTVWDTAPEDWMNTYSPATAANIAELSYFDENYETPSTMPNVA